MPSQTSRNQEAEMAVLGEILAAGKLGAAEDLELRDFVDTRHQATFAAMRLVAERGDPVSPVVVVTALRDSGQLERAGGPSYVYELEGSAIGASMLEVHIRLVREATAKRQIEEDALRTPAQLRGSEVEDVIADKRQFYSDLSLAPTIPGKEYFDWPTIAAQGKAYNARGKVTGLPELDRTVKLMPRELVIIGARVRHGKSSLAYNMLLSFLEQYPDEAQIFYNLDVPEVVLAARLATIRAKRITGESYGYKADVLPSFAEERFAPSIHDAFNWLHEQGRAKRLAIVNVPRFSAEQIAAHAERMAQYRKIGAIFVDYAELVKSKSRQESEELRLAHIVNTLRLAAERLSMLVVLISQMNRATVTEHSTDRRPRLESLRYSGRLEQEATTVLGIYNETAEAAPTESRDLEDDGNTVLQIIALKNRGGSSNRVLRFNFDQVSGNITPEEA